MHGIQYWPAEASDIPALAAIRATEWGTVGHWSRCIEDYTTGAATG